MTVMHSERLAPDAASRLAFHREPSAGCPRHTARLCIGSATRSRTCRKAKRLAAYLNALRPLRPHILQRYLHRGNRYLLARSMSPDPRARALRREFTLAEHVFGNSFAPKGWMVSSSFVNAQLVLTLPISVPIQAADHRTRCATHSTTDELHHDRDRTQFLLDQNYRLFRISNDEVLNGMDEVLTLIRDELRLIVNPLAPLLPHRVPRGSPSSPR